MLSRMLLWDLKTTKPVSIPLTGAVSSLVFSKGSRWLVGADDGGGALLWDLQAAEKAPVPLSDLSFDNTYPEFSRDSRWLVGADDEGGALLWDLRTAEEAPVPLTNLTLYYGPPPVFSEDSRWLVGADDEGGALLWDLQTTEPVSVPMTGTIDFSSYNVNHESSFSGITRWLVGADNEGGTLLWDLSAAKPVSVPLTGTISALVFSDDSRWLVGTGDRGAQLWDLKASVFTPRSLNECGSESWQFTFGSNGRWLACVDARGNTFVWDLQALDAEPKRLGGGDTYGGQLYFSPNGLWVCGNQERLWLERLDSCKRTHPRILRGYERDITSLHFLDDQHTLVTIGRDGELRRWDLAREEIVLPPKLDGHKEAIEAIAFDPEKKRLVSLGRMGEVLKWDVTQPEPFPRTFPGLRFPVSLAMICNLCSQCSARMEAGTL